MKFEPLRGFRDYFPPDAGARSELFQRMRASARRCGFQEFEMPSVESLDLYRVKSGEEISRQLWTFEDKGGRAVALAAETTPSLARAFVSRAISEPLPIKWFTLSKHWRYEEPQSGRTREFAQFDLDILGVPGVEAEVELLSTAAVLLDDAGAAGSYAFRVNDRRLLQALADSYGVGDSAEFFRALDRYRKTSRSEFLEELARAGLSSSARQSLAELLATQGAGVSAEAVESFLDDLAPKLTGASEEIDWLKRLFELGRRVGLGDRLVLDLSVVRGLAYYTSTVFEAFDVEGELRSLFGGGRYDHLISLFGGAETPACGLALGDQVLEILLRKKGRWPDGEPGLDTYVVAVTAAEVPVALEWVARLRRARISADCDLMGRSLSRQLKEADRRRARRALILGPKELARGVVVERDLVTGSQRELPPDELLRTA